MYDAHSVPKTGEPNSVIQNYKNRVLDQERYINDLDKPYLDIDYSKHGNLKNHLIVPHQHIWDVLGNRGKGGIIE